MQRKEKKTDVTKDNQKRSKNFFAEGEKLYQKFLKEIGVNVTPTNIQRIGIDLRNKHRPMKITLNCEEEKKTIFRNIHKLKGKIQFDHIRVTEDFTPNERETLKRWYEKANERNQNMQSTKFVWRVRGSPKTELRLMRVPKPKHLESFIES